MNEVVIGQGPLGGLSVTQAELGGGRSRLRTIWRVALPVLVVAVVLAGFVSVRLHAYGGDVTGFVNFGQKYVAQTHPPSGAVVSSPGGYDGQFFYLQATDPLLLHDRTIAAMRAASQAFRLQRMAYPALTYVLAGGSRSGLAVALLVANVLVLLALAGFFAVYAARRGWSVLWVIALALMPGLLLPVLRDLSDTLATGCLLVGVLLAQSGRRWSAAIALMVAVLTREVAIAVVLVLGIEAGIRAWRTHSDHGQWRAVVRAGWPVFAMPVLAFGLWQTWVAVRYGGLAGTSTATFPGVNLIQEVRGSIAHAPVATYAAWDVIYLGLVVAGIFAALASLRRGITIPGLAACAASLGVLLPFLGDAWSDARVSAPLFALLLVDALQRRRRATLALCAAVAGMTLLIPISIPGAF
jgi:hypothetical protein